MASKFNTGYSFNTTKLTKKITKDSKKNKFKIKPPEFIYTSNQRGRRVKKKNPKYAEWLKRNQKIDQQVDKYVKDRKVPINKDLTKDNSKKNKKSNEVKNNNKEVTKEKPKYKQVSQKELDAKVKEMSKPKEKPDPLKDYRRGEGTKLGKDTRITKRLKKAGWTEDRLAAKRKAHAEWKANRKKKKNKLKIGG